MLAEALRVFAGQMVDDCRREVPGPELPPEVAAAAKGLERMAERIEQAEYLIAGVENLIFAREGRGPCVPLEFPPWAWRAAAGAVRYLAEEVRAAKDYANSDRLRELAATTEAIGDWHEGVVAAMRKMEQVRAGRQARAPVQNP